MGLARMVNERRFVNIYILFIILNVTKVIVLSMFTTYNDYASIEFIVKLIISFSFIYIFYYYIFMIKIRIVFIFIYIIQVLFLLLIVTHFIYFKRHIHIFMSLELRSEGVEAIRVFAIPFSPIMVIAFLDLPFFLFFVMKYRKISKIINITKKLKYYLYLSVFIFFLVETTGFVSGNSFYHKMQSNHVSDNEIVMKYGSLGLNLMDLFKANFRYRVQEQIVYGELLENRFYPKQKHSIVVIQVESLDANLVGLVHEGVEITPFLNRLRTSSIYYPYVLSYHKAGGSSDCEIAVFNGFEPLDSFPTSQMEGYDFQNSFIHAFHDAGFRTKAFHGNRSSFYRRDETYPRKGFEWFFGYEELGLEPRIWGALDHEVFEAMMEMMVQEQDPFLYYCITMTTHAPFGFIEDHYLPLNAAAFANPLVYNYFNSFAYLDHYLERLIHEISDRFPDTYIFLFGDHTAAIEAEEYSSSGIVYDYKYFEFVPLFILTPERESYLETQLAPSFLDIGITILEAAGVPYSIQTFGETLLNLGCLEKKVPFSGAEYDRAFLFQLIQEHRPVNRIEQSTGISSANP